MLAEKHYSMHQSGRRHELHPQHQVAVAGSNGNSSRRRAWRFAGDLYGRPAIWHTADEIIAKGTRIAAEALEGAGAVARFSDARSLVAGTERSLTASWASTIILLSWRVRISTIR
jgi:hypothetical protein